MGHTRLGTLPRTRAWNEVVGLIAAGADIETVARATINAADRAFSFVQDDCGYNQAVWLLTQLGLAGKSPNPMEFLRERGVSLSENTSLPEVVSALSHAMDAADYKSGKTSDLGELAHRALVDAVITRMETKLDQRSLFDMASDVTKKTLSDFSRQNEFAQLSREFYSRLTHECMQYFLSHTLATQLGDGQRFATTNQMSQFEDAMTTHCREASFIVEKYSGEWFSKHRYEEGGEISRESVQGFASWALKKISDELQAGAKLNGQ